MSQTNINFRMDSDLKREMEKTCRELGLNMTTAFTIFARKMTRERRIPFEVSIDSIPNAETIKAIQEVQALKKDPDKKVYGSFSEVLEELDEDE